ncbi:MAG: ComEC/Rec2 family competence protein [Vicingaceae bacterium]
MSLKAIAFVRLLIPLIVGIICFLNFNHLVSLFYVLFVVSFISFLSLFFLNLNHSKRWLTGITVIGMLLSLGYILSYYSNQNNIIDKEENFQLAMAEITEPVNVKDHIVKANVQLKAIKINNDWQATEDQLVLFLEKDNRSEILEVGDIITLTPQLEAINDSKNPHSFDYKKYMAYHHIHFQSFIKTNNWRLIKASANNSWYGFALSIRKKLIEILKEKGLKEKELAIASALILGYKDDLDANIKTAYSNTGAMHVLAVSGLHVGIIFLMLNYMFFWMDKSKKLLLLKTIIIVFSLAFYATLTGLSPSVNRATLMFSIIAIGKAFGKHTNIFNNIALSAFILLLIEPNYITSVGFQLSYLAVTGIIIIQPFIYKLLYVKNALLDKIWALTSVSIAAQIATFPISIFYFHQFPNYFFISNLIVIPAATIILSLGLGALLFYKIPVVNDVLFTVLNKTISFLNLLIEHMADWRYAVSENLYLSVFQTLLIYTIIVCLIIWIANYSKKAFFYALGLTILLLGLKNYDWWQHQNQRKIIVYSIKNNTAINFIDGEEHMLLTDLSKFKQERFLRNQMKNNWVYLGLTSEKPFEINEINKTISLTNMYRTSSVNLFFRSNFLNFYNYKMYLLDNKSKLPDYIDKKIKLDVLVLRNNPFKSLAKILKVFDPKKIIIDASNSNHFVSKAKDLFPEKIIDVKNEGAWIADIK